MGVSITWNYKVPMILPCPGACWNILAYCASIMGSHRSSKYYTWGKRRSPCQRVWSTQRSHSVAGRQFTRALVPSAESAGGCPAPAGTYREPSTTVVDRMLSWFHTTDKGGNQGVAAGEVRGAHRLSAGDGAGMGTLVDRGGTTSHAPLYPPCSSSPRLGLSPRLAHSLGAHKWLRSW